MYVLMLGLVLILIYESLDPRNWEWIANRGAVPAAVHSTPDGKNVAPLHAPQTLPGDLKVRLQEFRDDTLQIRPAEQPLYWELLRKAQLEHWGATQSPLPAPRYDEIVKQISEKRGEFVSVTGTLRRLRRFEVEESGQPERSPVTLYEGWFFTSDSGVHPWVVHFLTPPSEEETEHQVSRSIQVTGLLLKLYQYESQAGLSAAPLLVTDQVQLTSSTDSQMQRTEKPFTLRRWSLIPVAFVLLAGLFVLKFFRPFPRGGRKSGLRKRGSLPERIDLPKDFSEVDGGQNLGESETTPEVSKGSPTG